MPAETSREITFRWSVPRPEAGPAAGQGATRLHREAELVPRRFQPRLAAGFDEQAGDGLRDFDRHAPLWLAEIPIWPGLALVALAAAVGCLGLLASLAG